MSGCNMLKQAATCPAATCLNRQQHVRLQHAQTGYNFLWSPRCYSCCTADKAYNLQRFTILSIVSDSISKGSNLCSFFNAVGDGATKFLSDVGDIG
jgi:hypothetical protein